MILKTDTLVLEILKQNDTLNMSVFKQEELAHTLKHYSQLSLSFLEIDKLGQEVTSILNKAYKLGASESDLIESLKKTGQLLWDHLLTKAVKDRLKATQILDLILAIDEELIRIPWELLYDGKVFLCLKFNVGRVVRTKEQTDSPPYRNSSSVPRMLILANPTNDLKSAYLEGTFIKNQFDKKRKEITIDFKSTSIDTLYIKKNLRDYDIVHFAGHCEYDSNDSKNSGWVLSDGKFTARDIYAMGETLPLPTLIFSNACYSANVASNLMDANYQEKAYSLASAFLFSGVRHYIGAIRRIEDPISLAFAKEFYTQLISGKSVGECMRMSRLRLIKEYGITSIPWASYLLYGDPNFILFRPKSKTPITKLRKPSFLYKKSFVKLSLKIIIIFIVCLCLYLWLPTINPNTYFMFLKSRTLFLNGRNEEAISLSRRIIKKDPLFLAVYPLLADSYQRLGKRNEALKYYFEYAFSCEKKIDTKNLSDAYIGIGWIYHLQGEYPKALDFYNKAIALSRDNNDNLHEAVALRKLAVWYIDKDNYDKALELLMKSSGINLEKKFMYEHQYNLACDYFDIGLVFMNKDDRITAKEFYVKSKLIFEKLRLKNELSDYYFNLGEVYLFEKQYQKALEYYFKGLKIDQAQGNKPGIASDYNMIGELYLEMDNLVEAEKFFYDSILVCKQTDVRLELAEVYYNLGLLYKKKNQKNKTREFFRLAQEIYRLIDTSDYQNIKQEFLRLE